MMTLIPVGHVSSVLPDIMPYLQESEQWTGGRATVDDILRFVLTGQMHLWVVHTDHEVLGHVITEFKQYPQRKFLVVQYCAGKHNQMQYVEKSAFEVLECFAKDAGCDGIEFIGRAGWKKAASNHGYEMRSVTYQKLLGE